MKYSEIVGKGFYNIELSTKHQRLVDIYFSGASHHLYRYNEAVDQRPELVQFHLERHKAHLRHLMEIVYLYGNFSCAYDYSLRDMDYKESWNPDMVHMPDPDMFSRMLPDARYAVGEFHPFDLNLKNLEPPATKVDTRVRAIRVLSNYNC